LKNIYVGNIPFSANEEELKALFSAHGGVARVNVVTDRETGSPRGFAFVEMTNDKEGEAAIAALNGTSMGGRSLTVNEARPREPRSGGGGGGGRGGYGGGGGGGGGGRIWLRAFVSLTITSTGSVLSQGSGGGQFGAPTFQSNFGGGGAGGGIMLDCCSDITIAGTVDNRGRLANTLSTTNGGTLKLFHQDNVNNTGTVQTGRLYDGGQDSSSQLCNAAPSIPSIISPLDEDVSVKNFGDVFIGFVWTESTDPEGSSVTYEVDIANVATFSTIEKSSTGITGTTSAQVITVSSLPVVKYWRVRARDAQGRESAWSSTSTIRLVLDDGINHGGGDCTISAGVGPGALMPAIFCAALLAFGLARRRA
jgi:hypothetical protein